MTKWRKVTEDTIDPIVTIADLVTVTGLSRRTVRDTIARYKVSPLPRNNPHDTTRYLRQHVIAAIKAMPGSGNHRRKTRDEDS